MIEKGFASGGVDAFLEFIRQVESAYRQAEITEQESNDQTQDLLHKLELETEADTEFTCEAKILKKVRKERRKAKDTIDMLSPIRDWAEANKNTVKGLEQLLGKVRKAEKNTENRIYTYKSEKFS